MVLLLVSQIVGLLQAAKNKLTERFVHSICNSQMFTLKVWV
jgi:hypothetical protein